MDNLTSGTSSLPNPNTGRITYDIKCRFNSILLDLEKAKCAKQLLVSDCKHLLSQAGLASNQRLLLAQVHCNLQHLIDSEEESIQNLLKAFSKFYKSSKSEVLGVRLSDSSITLCNGPNVIDHELGLYYLQDGILPEEIVNKATKDVFGNGASWVSKKSFVAKLLSTMPYFFAISADGDLVHVV